MKAIVISSSGGPEVLELRDVPTPQPVADQVLVRVRAAGLNRADLMQRAGHYPAPPGFPQDIPGMEFAGEVAELGSDARMWKPGQRVFAITGGGAYAEFIIAHERTLAEVPPNLDWVEAASIPEVFITAHDAMWKQAALRPCETVLVHAVGSGVGLAAVQLARAIGAVPYGTSRTHDKLQRAREYGMEDGVELRESLEPLQHAVDRWTSGRGVSVVMELVGGSYVNASLRALAAQGRLMVIGTGAGSNVQLDLRPLLTRRLNMRGTVLRARPLEEKIAATRAFAEEVVPLFARGVLRTVIDSQFPLEQAAAAHARLESNQTFGKVVLRLD
ncbi:MAG: NAD(P)H-quinone oxidoreductase [Acidobacteria bacterium]|nr:NAD(P)H-quinone oxidoreductase [Acidobacteriota bacterium]